MNTKNRLIEKLLKVAKKYKILTYPVLALVAVISVLNYFFSWSTGAGKRVVAVVMVLVMLVSQSYFLTSSATALVDTEETVQKQQELQAESEDALIDDSDVESDALVQGEKVTEIPTQDTESQETIASESSSKTTTQVTETTTEVVTSTETTEDVFVEDDSAQTDVGTQQSPVVDETSVQADKSTGTIKANIYGPGNQPAGSVDLVAVEGGYTFSTEGTDISLDTVEKAYTADGYYEVEGWYSADARTASTKVTYSDGVISGVTPVNNSIDLFLKTIVKKYEVTIVDAGGYTGITSGGATTSVNNDGVYEISATNGAATFTIDSPAKIGYELSGATVNSAKGDVAIVGSNLQVTLDEKNYKVTVTVLWEPESFSVVYTDHKGENASTPQTLKFGTDNVSSFASAQEVSNNILSAKPGYKFVGWYVGSYDSSQADSITPITPGNTISETYKAALYTTYVDNGKTPAQISAVYKYAGVQLDLNETNSPITFQYLKSSTGTTIKAKFIDLEDSVTGNFEYTINAVTVTPKNGSPVVLNSASDLSGTDYNIDLSVTDAGIKVTTSGPKFVGSVKVEVVVIDRTETDNPKTSDTMSFDIRVNPRAIILDTSGIDTPTKTYDGNTDINISQFIKDGKLPTDVEGVYVAVASGDYVDESAGNQSVKLTIPDNWMVLDNGVTEDQNHFSLDTSNALIPGIIEQRPVYIKTSAAVSQVRAGEPNPTFNVTEVSSETNLVGEDKGNLAKLVKLEADPERDNPAEDDLILHGSSTGWAEYDIVPVVDATSNYAFYVNSSGGTGTFKVVMEKALKGEDYTITQANENGWHSEVIIEAISGSGYNSVRLKGSTQAKQSLKITKNDIVDGYVTFQLYDSTTGAFTEYAKEFVQLDTSEPEFVKCEVLVENTGASTGDGLYFVSEGGNVSLGHYYNTSIYINVTYKDDTSRPYKLNYTLTSTLGDGNTEEKTVFFDSATGNASLGGYTATAVIEVPAGLIENGENLANKLFTVSFIAEDEAGNESNRYRFMKDGANDDEWAVEQYGPEVSVWQVTSNGAVIKGDSDKYYSNCFAYLEVEDATSGIKTVTWVVNGKEYVENVSVDRKITKGTFEVEVNNENYPCASGEYTIYPVIEDNAGNIVSLEDRAKTFKVDNDKPDVVVIDRDKITTTYQKEVTLAFTAVDKLSGVQYVKIATEDGELTENQYKVEEIGTDENNCKIYKCYVNTTKKGTYIIEAADVAGNVYKESIVLDKVSSENPACPTISLQPEANDKGWFTAEQGQILIDSITKTEDGTPVVTKYKLWNEKDTPSIHESEIDSDDERSIPIKNGTSSIGIQEDGIYKLMLWTESATDVLCCEDVETENHIHTIQVDSQAPVIVSTYKSSDSGNTVIVEFTVEDTVSGVDMDTLQVLQGSTPVDYTIQEVATANNTTGDNKKYVGTFEISETGVYSIKVQDYAGNEAEPEVFTPMSMKVNKVRSLTESSAIVGAQITEGSWPFKSATITYYKLGDDPGVAKEAETVESVDETTGKRTITGNLTGLEKGTVYVYTIKAYSTDPTGGNNGETLVYSNYFRTLPNDGNVFISGRAEYADPDKNGTIIVGLYEGNVCIQTYTVDTNDSTEFSFDNVSDGTYTIVASDNEYTNSAGIVIQDGRVIYPEGDLVIKLSGKSTSIEINGAETPNVTVSNMEDVLFDEDSYNYDDEDRAVIENGGSVEFKLTASIVKVVPTEVDAAIYAVDEATGKLIGAYIDLTIYKYVRDENGNLIKKVQVHKIGNGDELIITVPLGDLATKSGLIVVRTHLDDGSYDGSYRKDIDSSSATYTFKTGYFSTYALLYDPDPVEEEPTTTEAIQDGSLAPSADGAIYNATDNEEVEADDKESDKGDSDNKSSVGSLRSSGSAKTGDATPITLMFGIMLISVTGIVLIRKKQREDLQ